MSTQEIAFATKRTKRLIKQYEEIIEHYGEQSHVLKQLFDFQPKVK